MRKTKIVCTIGPASESLEKMKKLILSGLNVARLNFSHGNFEEHGKRIEIIRQAAKELKKTVGIMLDTKGPEIRLGKLLEEPLELVQNEKIIMTTEEIMGNMQRIPVTYKELPKDVKVGSTILIDDGLVGLRVDRIEGTEIYCTIQNNGQIKSNKGVNVPGVSISMPGLTEKDIRDIKFGVDQGVDFIAASFVRRASDVLEIHELLEHHQGQHIQIISKIENEQGVDNLDEILAVSDGIMVARGDMGVEIPVEEVPLVQKTIIEKCNRVGKPVITATQMLDSMQRNPRPTRAEASDVANAIFDGTDAIMLSGETAAGKYPEESVSTMAKIAERTETALPYRELLKKQVNAQQVSITEAISQSVAQTSLDLDVKAIITSTASGHTARMISKYKPNCRIIAVTPSERTMRHLQLVWGASVMKGSASETTDEMFEIAVGKAMESEFIQMGDTVIITAGVPVGKSGSTNLVKIHHIGELIAEGQGIGTQSATGKVVVASSAEEANRKMTAGAILVSVSTNKEYMPALKKAAAVIIENGGITSHTAIAGLNLGIPVLIDVKDATHILKDGMEITLYAQNGVVYSGQAKVS